MRINYTLDENNYIIGYTIIPFDETQPSIQIDDVKKIHIGISQIINHKFVANDEQFEQVQAEKKRISILQNEVNELNRKLASTDYEAIKFAEGEISAEDFAPIKEQRKAWRVRINELENELEESN